MYAKPEDKAAAAELEKQKTALLERIDTARMDRTHFTEVLNKYYELALPWRQPISHTLLASCPRSFDEQADIFDTTLQDAVADFAAMMSDLFTPHYKPWAELKPVGTYDKALLAKAKPLIEQRQAKIYDLIRQSDFYEQAQQVYLDMAGSKGGMVIPFAKRGKKIRCTPVVMSGLLDDVGPNGELDMRAMEFVTKKKHLESLFPDEWEEMKKDQKWSRMQGNAECTVIQGGHRGDDDGKWTTFLVINNKVCSLKTLEGEGAMPVHVLRWQDAAYSAWGPGPGIQALPSARVLQEMGFLFLKNLAKSVDPPFAYTEDGLFNPDGGIEAGMALPMEKGTDFKSLLFERDLNPALFEREIHVQRVKRALFVDEPEQKGKTPPTAAQWIDERAQTDRRLQISRIRIYKEWVMSVLQRYNWILERRGETPKIEIDGTVVHVAFDSPITKTSDADEVSRSMQLTQSAVGMFGETALQNIDAATTIGAWKEKMGDKLLTLKPFDERSEAEKLLMQNMRNTTSRGQA
ncbi:MAG: hypothetical protein B7Z36_05975 [Novosphingobium sp. 12-63-9]|nr:MAG: hypothetical protein B7Z36_05975 [Novosphingobium sp. 12-63-9]